MAYSQHVSIDVDESGETVLGDASFDLELFSAEFPGGLIADRDFHATFEGSLRFESATQAATYRMDVSTEHDFGAGTTIANARTYYYRAGRNNEIAIPMDVFSSITRVSLGEYAPPGGGDPIEITQAMLDSPVDITVSLSITRDGNSDWELSKLLSQGLEVVYWQDDLVPAVEDYALEAEPDAQVPDSRLSALVARVAALEARESGGGGRDAGAGYATAAEYRARTGSSADDDLLAALLAAAARYIDRRLGWAPGSFAPGAEATVRLWPRRSSRILRLRDPAGQQIAVRSWSRIAADYSGRGEADRVWTPSGDGEWVRLEPDGSSGWPGRSIRLWESHRDAEESAWPSDPGCVDVTHLPGFAATPPAVGELSIHVARSMLDLHSGGAAAMVSALESPLPLGSDGERLWRRVEMEYSAGRPGRLGVVVSSAGSRR